FTKTSGSGNTATFTAISSGACWVGIKVGNVDIVKYNVWVGEPAIPYIISTERTHYNGTYTFTATGTTSGNPINCQWRIYTSIYGSLPLYMFTSPFPEGSYTFTNAPPVSASSPDVYYVSVVVNTSCGYSRESDMQRFTVQKGPLEIPIYYSAAYPNPAGNELIIDKIENSEALLTNTVKSVKEKSSEVTVLLYSHSTTKLVYNKTYPSSAKQIKIDTSTLPNGTYYLNIIENGEKIKQQTIIINH
ncbi:MAG: T9SS type A sorting domain-containing protein, partial [Prevotellaceae bacterium]|nr:T9SS type A sorting domain-containing protein [Prevotellaceae bacterium]